MLPNKYHSSSGNLTYVFRVTKSIIPTSHQNFSRQLPEFFIKSLEIIISLDTKYNKFRKKAKFTTNKVCDIMTLDEWEGESLPLNTPRRSMH